MAGTTLPNGEVVDRMSTRCIINAYPPGDSIFRPTPARKGGLSLNSRESSVDRVITYIDGYNLYHGLRERVSTGILHIGRVELSKNMLPDQIIKDGIVLKRPASWY